MLSDFHIHSCHSDGTYTAQMIVSACKKNNIKFFSVCDHNTIDIYCKTDIEELAKKEGLTLVTGCEFDCTFLDEAYHVLAYGCDVHSKAYADFVKTVRTPLDYMSDMLISRMEADGYDVSVDEYENYSYDKTNGGWKGVNYLCEKKIIPNVYAGSSLYTKYDITYKEAGFPDLEFLTASVHAAGGVCVLAHPAKNLKGDFPQMKKTLTLMKKKGLSGLECYYPSHTHEFTNFCLDFCNKNNMMITGGSDFHGDEYAALKGGHYNIGVICPEISSLNLKNLLK